MARNGSRRMRDLRPSSSAVGPSASRLPARVRGFGFRNQALHGRVALVIQDLLHLGSRAAECARRYFRTPGGLEVHQHGVPCMSVRLDPIPSCDFAEMSPFVRSAFSVISSARVPHRR